MISETLAPFVTADIVVLLWGLVASLWVLAHLLIKDITWFGNKYGAPGPMDYAIAGVTIVMLSALSFIVLIWTLSIMGV